MKRALLLTGLLLALATLTYGQFKFTSIDCPGAEQTRTYGINNHGDIVGACQYPGDVMHAVLIRKGKFIPLAPRTVLGTHLSAALHINDRGDVVGIFIGDDGFYHGFLLRHGVLTILNFPGANETVAYDINESGTVTGYRNLYDSSGTFLYQGGFTWKNGNFTDVTFPGSGDTSAQGINDHGDIVGCWDSGPSATIGHSFVFSKGQFTSFDVPFPGVVYTDADDINNAGVVVGYYAGDPWIPHGFMKVGLAFTRIDYPGARSTWAHGINSLGQIVGKWKDLSGLYHGWLAVPSFIIH